PGTSSIRTSSCSSSSYSRPSTPSGPQALPRPRAQLLNLLLPRTNLRMRLHLLLLSPQGHGYVHHPPMTKTNEPDNPWNEAQLSKAYCSTPNVKCDSETPTSSIDNALFICLCDQPSQKVGNHLEFLCGCDKCLVVKPDYRGRCKTPPLAGSKGGKGNKVRGTNRLGFWM
ncbi:hypothetical protein FOXYSP1_11937, partial [Fusarium oxysporum f. sp. phaseoli]